jgi:hypothetical protein
VIGSVFFGTLVVAKPTFTGRPSAAELTAAIAQNTATGFTHSAASAMAVSAAFALVAFFLVFTLPKRINRGWEPAPVDAGASAGAEGAH